MSPAETPNGPQPLRLHYSRPRAVFVLGVVVLIALWLGYVALAGLLAGHIVLLITGAVAALVLAPLLIAHVREPIRALTRTEAVVTLDARGITDLRRKDAFLSWDDIGQISLGDRQPNRSYLIVEFRHQDIARSRRQGAFTFFARKAASLGDWHVNLRPLARKDDEVLRTARRLHQLAIRRRVVERNGPSSQGWSGSL